MQASQYLVLAREINRNEHGIFSFIDVCQHLAVNELPAKGKFDMAIICGPGWEPGKHRIHIATKISEKEARKIGFADVEIVDSTHIYTAVVKNLGLIIDNDKGFAFQVYKESHDIKDAEETKNDLPGEVILERPFNVNVLNPQPQEQQAT
jgi:hypothetical protein